MRPKFLNLFKILPNGNSESSTRLNGKMTANEITSHFRIHFNMYTNHRTVVHNMTTRLTNDGRFAIVSTSLQLYLTDEFIKHYIFIIDTKKGPFDIEAILAGGLVVYDDVDKRAAGINFPAILHHDRLYLGEPVFLDKLSYETLKVTTGSVKVFDRDNSARYGWRRSAVEIKTKAALENGRFGTNLAISEDGKLLMIESHPPMNHISIAVSQSRSEARSSVTALHTFKIIGDFYKEIDGELIIPEHVQKEWFRMLPKG